METHEARALRGEEEAQQVDRLSRAVHALDAIRSELPALRGLLNAVPDLKDRARLSQVCDRFGNVLTGRL